MLVLTRKTGQKLIIDDNIEIIILETKGEAVKIGIKAPKNITIYREEIYEEIKKANQQSSKNVLVSDLDFALDFFGSDKKIKQDWSSKFQAVANVTTKKVPEDKGND